MVAWLDERVAFSATLEKTFGEKGMQVAIIVIGITMLGTAAYGLHTGVMSAVRLALSKGAPSQAIIDSSLGGKDVQEAIASGYANVYRSKPLDLRKSAKVGIFGYFANTIINFTNEWFRNSRVNGKQYGKIEALVKAIEGKAPETYWSKIAVNDLYVAYAYLDGIKKITPAQKEDYEDRVKFVVNPQGQLTVGAYDKWTARLVECYWTDYWYEKNGGEKKYWAEWRRMKEQWGRNWFEHWEAKYGEDGKKWYTSKIDF